MGDFDGEIEYLDEDAEIVQQCVQMPKVKQEPITNRQPINVVEKPRSLGRKRIKTEETDSDYDPTGEIAPLSPPIKKKKVIKKSKGTSVGTRLQYASKNPDYQYMSAKQQYLQRKKLNIRIPDYGDPLCLPVRAIKIHESDKKRLNNWNKVCLEHFKYCDEILKPERGETKKSARTAVFKNVVNKLTGGVETTIWSKTCVENYDGDKKSEIFQCVLPRYKEKKVLNNYLLGNRILRATKHTSEVILSKEDHKNGEALVVYKPQESVSAVYGFIDKRKQNPEDDASSAEEYSYLQELASCQLCAPCFQGSWRGVTNIKNKSLVCPICARTFASVYNLLSHLKTHSPTDVRRFHKIIGAILAEVVAYHYKCRVCWTKFDSIKSLRKHVLKHESTLIFRCEVGNHLVNAN